MKRFDYLLQNWRYSVVIPLIPFGSEILDIGGFDGSLLLRVREKIKKGYCIDPLIYLFKDDKLEFIKEKINNKSPFLDSSFDVITMIAVFEHLGNNRDLVVNEVYRLLKKNGLIILTIPDKLVDNLLKIFSALRLIDGLSIEEHDHYEVSDTLEIFLNQGFALMKKKKVQLGLNNLFIFKK